jgi:flagellar assembly protein FliH
MMSLSDQNDDFKPIDVNALDSFENEQFQKPEGAEPDLDRFKMLFDPKDFEQEDITFKELFSIEDVKAEGPFEALIEGTDEDASKTAVDGGGVENTEVPDLPDEPPPPSPEELGFEQGFQKGLEEGRATGNAEGEAKGFEEGHAKGEAEGFAKGEIEGFAKGEAEGLEKGITQGREQAEAEVREAATKILDPLKESLETVDTLLERLIQRYEGQILDLVFKIAEKAVGAKIDTDDEVIRETILDALHHLVAPEEITLSVSNEDYEYVEMVKEEFFAAVRSLKHVAVASDPMIPKGGCRIETAAATISTDPEAKLAAIYDAIARTGR